MPSGLWHGQQEGSSQDEPGDSAGEIPAGIGDAVSLNILCPFEIKTPFWLRMGRTSRLSKDFQRNRPCPALVWGIAKGRSVSMLWFRFGVVPGTWACTKWRQDTGPHGPSGWASTTCSWRRNFWAVSEQAAREDTQLLASGASSPGPPTHIGTSTTIALHCFNWSVLPCCIACKWRHEDIITKFNPNPITSPWLVLFLSSPFLQPSFNDKNPIIQNQRGQEPCIFTSLLRIYHLLTTSVALITTVIHAGLWETALPASKKLFFTLLPKWSLNVFHKNACNRKHSSCSFFNLILIRSIYFVVCLLDKFYGCCW